MFDQSLNLPPRCEEAARLRCADKLRVEDIADRMSICHQRVSQHLANARKRSPAYAMLERFIWGTRRPRRIA